MRPKVSAGIGLVPVDGLLVINSRIVGKPFLIRYGEDCALLGRDWQGVYARCTVEPRCKV